MAGYIPDEIVERVIASSDIVEVIGSFVPLKKIGRSYKALCPFHAEKTPSFVVNPERQIFHCFGCGEGGDVVSFLMKREHFTFPEAVRYLAERSGIPIMARAGGRGEGRRLPLYEVHRIACDIFRRNLRSPEGARAREYLRTRGIDEEAEEGFLLGYALPSWDGLLRALGSQGFSPSLLAEAGLVIPRAGKGGYYDRFRDRLMIPIQDATGRVIGFGGRSLDGSEPKYLNSPETPIYRKGGHLYGLHLAIPSIRERGFALVVEGYFDLISLHLYGFSNSVAVLGTAFTEEQARLLARYTKKVILVFDRDAAGLTAAEKRGPEGWLHSLIEPAGLFKSSPEWSVVLLPPGEDPDTFIRKYGSQGFTAQLAQARDLIEFLWDRRTLGLNMQDPDDQAKGLNEILLPLLASIDDPVVRARYTQKLLQKIGLSHGAVVEQLNRLLIHGRRALETPLKPPKAPASAERILIHIALHDPAMRQRIVEALEVEDFSDRILRQIFAAQKDRRLREPPSVAASESGDREGGLVVSRLDPEVQQELTGLLAIGLEAYEGVLEKTVSDCIRSVKRRRERLYREELRKKLEEAQQIGDEATLKLLKAAHPEWRKALDLNSQKGGEADRL